MNRQIVRIAPWQAGKVSAVVYFAVGLLFAIPFSAFTYLVPAPAGQPQPGILVAVMLAVGMPILYALIGLIFVPLVCWIYNLAAKLVGGLSFSVETKERT